MDAQAHLGDTASLQRLFEAPYAKRRRRHPKGIAIPELENLAGPAAQAVADALEKIKCEVNRSSIYRWFAKFIPVVREYLRQIPIRTGEHAVADEVCMSNKDDDEDGKNDAKKSAAADAQPEEPDKTPAAEAVRAADVQPQEPERKKWYLFSTTDLKTRFCTAFDVADHKDCFNATNLLKETLRRTGKVPSAFITDGIPSYSEAHQGVFAAKNPLDKHSIHVSDSGLSNKKKHNNFQERFNGTYRRFESPRQNIPNPHSPLITGFFVYYNFVRPPFKPERTYARRGGRHHNPRADKMTIIGNACLTASAREAGP